MIALSILPATSEAQWIHANTGLTDNYVSTIVVSGTNLFAATNAGGVHLSTNQGASWTPVNSGMSENSVRALCVSGSDIFAGTIHGGVFLSTNNGASWTSRNIPWYVDVEVLMFSCTTLFAGTGYSYGGVLKSTDNGQSWSVASNGLSSAYVRAFALHGPYVFTGTEDGVYRSSDNGDSWSAVNTGLTNTKIMALAAADTNLYCGTFGGVFVSTNNGTTWSPINAGLPSIPVWALAFCGTTLYAGMYPGGVFASSNAGSSWAPLDTNQLDGYINYLTPSGTNIYASIGGSYPDGVYRRDTKYLSAPSIVSVCDIPSDQGGKVRVIWNRSCYDAGIVSSPIVSYGIWRSVPPGEAPSPSPSRRLMKTLSSKLTQMYDFVASVPVVHFDQYGYVVPTPSDSSSSGFQRYNFLVSAHTADPSIFYLSEPDSGYSVDNLCPASPSGLVAGSFTDGLVRLTWSCNRTDNDVNHYTVYRSTVDRFPIDPATLLLTTRDTTTVDSSAGAGATYYYQVTCVDLHGNESAPTSVVSIVPLSLELESFTASIQRWNVQLDWLVASQQNCAGYAVERSSPGCVTWETAGIVAVEGTVAMPQRYSFIDHIVSAGSYWYRIEEMKNDGSFQYSRSIQVEASLAPTEFQLSQNYPNPFNPSTTIQYSLPSPSIVRLTIFNALGQRVEDLVNTVQDAGYRSAVWNTSIASGIYFYQLEATSVQDPSNRFVSTKKMWLLK